MSQFWTSNKDVKQRKARRKWHEWMLAVGSDSVWTTSKNISCSQINLRTKTLRLIGAKTYCYQYRRILALTTSAAWSSRRLFYSSRPLGRLPPTNTEWHSRRDKLPPVVTPSIWQTHGRRRRRRVEAAASSMYACSVLLVATWTTSLTGNHHFRLPYLPLLLFFRLRHCCCCCCRKPCNDAVLWLMTCATSHLRRPTVSHGNRNLGKTRALRSPPLPYVCRRRCAPSALIMIRCSTKTFLRRRSVTEDVVNSALQFAYALGQMRFYPTETNRAFATGIVCSRQQNEAFYVNKRQFVVKAVDIEHKTRLSDS